MKSNPKHKATFKWLFTGIPTGEVNCYLNLV